MSDRLAIAAALSVLMMSIYVLFGADAMRMPFALAEFPHPFGMAIPEAAFDAGNFLR